MPKYYLNLLKLELSRIVFLGIYMPMMCLTPVMVSNQVQIVSLFSISISFKYQAIIVPAFHLIPMVLLELKTMIKLLNSGS